ncbi:hypothetical protein ACFPOI_28865 [Nonomuraea angiospora]|uniref:Uncharacterized protein n=1 Tax=Nonomuraea angiospora TaxID=46172 RepID=A0ABR9LUT6_9ACTN|nr:hypothetical protein [Nonomuraea angiospora]MBE1584080.1 hypothetical protein [Nonomuraea angiospora]
MSGRNAFAAVLPKLVLVAAVLLGVGLSYATAHFCAAAHTAVGACASASGDDHPGMSAGHGSSVGSDHGPVVLCLAALAAVVVVFVLALFGLGRPNAIGRSGAHRPRELPAVRGSPLPYALSLRRVAVLRT